MNHHNEILHGSFMEVCVEVGSETGTEEVADGYKKKKQEVL
jgi:hypothetical protein